MKRFFKEIIILFIQLFMFYIFPLFVWNSDPMGMVFLIICATLILSIIIASISKEKIKSVFLSAFSSCFCALFMVFGCFKCWNNFRYNH